MAAAGGLLHRGQADPATLFIGEAYGRLVPGLARMDTAWFDALVRPTGYRSAERLSGEPLSDARLGQIWAAWKVREGKRYSKESEKETGIRSAVVLKILLARSVCIKKLE